MQRKFTSLNSRSKQKKNKVSETKIRYGRKIRWRKRTSLEYEEKMIEKNQENNKRMKFDPEVNGNGTNGDWEGNR